VIALASLQVDSAISYAIAIIIPALDAILPVLPSETVIIALGVATAGSADPRIALLVACAAFGAFLGDNLCYLLGRRFGPHIERRFFRGAKGARRRAWAERSLQRYGMPLIVVCRFIPGGRTAVTLCCGIIGYQRRRFVIATAAAGLIWAAYSFFIGRLGGRAFEDKPWAGLLLAFGVTIAVSGLIEMIRRIRSARSPLRGRHAGQVEADDAGQDQAHRHQLQGGHRIAEEDHAHGRGADGADPGPHRVCGSHLELAQRHGQQREAHQRADGEDDRRPQPGHPMAQLQRHRETCLEQPGGENRHPRHRVTPLLPHSGHASFIARRRGIQVCR
jgi:membrane protein DedA with SNARE-associated domain